LESAGAWRAAETTLQQNYQRHCLFELEQRGHHAADNGTIKTVILNPSAESAFYRLIHGGKNSRSLIVPVAKSRIYLRRGRTSLLNGNDL
jgi:hypothetical protein